jgi:hypothetical protein
VRLRPLPVAARCRPLRLLRRLAGGAEEVKNLYRIENVSTKRAERITANEEERVRQGYEMQTTLQFAEAEGKLQMVTTVVEDAEGPLLEMQYGPAATVWRMNFGWRRRKDKSIQGFMMNPVTGHWVGGVDDGNGESESEGDAPPDKTPPQRIVPYVEDRRNILIVRPHHRLGVLEAETLTTLQYALKRGIEAVYQLEESELMAEPLPTRDNRQSILLFEAAEGGAGVLTRLPPSPMHWRPWPPRRWRSCTSRHRRQASPGSSRQRWSKNSTTTASPIARPAATSCLLSYYNQPDHALIDRKDKDAGGLVLDMLCRLTQARTNKAPGSSAEQHAPNWRALRAARWNKPGWTMSSEHGHRKPDRGQHTIAGASACADFFYDDLPPGRLHRRPAPRGRTQRAQDAVIDRKLDELGYLVVRFPKDTGSWPDIFKNNADLFGPGKPKP